MTIVEALNPFLGTWRGVNRLRLLPTDEYRESEAAATVSLAAQNFVTVTYTWVEDGAPQDGMMLLASTAEPPGVTAVWVDSWHSSAAWMSFTGGIEADGVIRLYGSYAAPEGPDWGWQIHIESDGDTGRITMHNVVPGEDPYQAVEMAYDRRGD
jgi:hypothetical protein